MNIQKIKNKYDKLLNKISKLGFIITGSISTIYYKCGRKNCACSKDNTKKHGPYLVLTSKIEGKTVTKRLTKNQFKICESYIENKKKLDKILFQMKELSLKAIELYK